MTSKILNHFLLMMIYLLSFQVYAQKILTLSPNESRQLTNRMMWTINATCKIHCTSQTHTKIKISVLKNSGSVNGKNLLSGQTTFVKIKNNASISVRAEPGAQINLMNLGGDRLQAVCST